MFTDRFGCSRSADLGVHGRAILVFTATRDPQPCTCRRRFPWVPKSPKSPGTMEPPQMFRNGGLSGAQSPVGDIRLPIAVIDSAFRAQRGSRAAKPASAASVSWTRVSTERYWSTVGSWIPANPPKLGPSVSGGDNVPEALRGHEIKHARQRWQDEDRQAGRGAALVDSRGIRQVPRQERALSHEANPSQAQTRRLE